MRLPAPAAWESILAAPSSSGTWLHWSHHRGELTIPTTPLMATASSANTCPPDKISSAFFCLARQQKGFPLWFFPTAVLNPQPRAALCQAVWRAGVLEVHQLKAMLAQMSWWALGYCRAFASSRPHNCWFLCLWERLA